MACADAPCSGTGISLGCPCGVLQGPRREGRRPKPTMNGPEKSDSPIVAVKPANEAARRRAASGAKGRDQGECGPANHGPDAEPGSRVTCAGSHTRSRNQEQSTAANHTPASCQRRCLAGGILRTEEERRAWGRWADVD